jgi:integrase
MAWEHEYQLGREVLLKAKSTLKHYRDYLEQYFNCAKQWGWIGANPVAHIRKYTKLNNARVRYLSNEERETLLKSCAESKNHYLYTIVVFALSTGVRRGELMNLTLNDLDLKLGQAILRDTKNGDTRVVAIVGYLRKILEDHIVKVRDQYAKLEKAQGHPIKTQYLFPSPTGQIIDFSNAFDFARKRANLEDFRFHDLRHCTASYLAMNGATLLEIASVLGHRTLQMVKRYSHLSENHTTGVLSRMNDKIFNLIPTEI